MTDEKILGKLREGVNAWNEWRESEKEGGIVHVLPDLSHADLIGIDLSHINFSKADLSRADLSDSDLSHADLSDARLIGTDLTGANLSGVTMKGAKLYYADLTQADLSYADLSGANLCGCDFSDALLTDANLSHADLSDARLIGTDLSGTFLSHADLRQALLVNTNVTGATLIGCRVYGISVWNMFGEPKEQGDLCITMADKDEPILTVDDLEVAQFVYLIMSYGTPERVITKLNSVAYQFDSIARQLIEIGEGNNDTDSINEQVRQLIASRQKMSKISTKLKEEKEGFTTSENSDKTAGVLEQIEKLAKLKEQGILSKTEFQTKKKELLSRL